MNDTPPEVPGTAAWMSGAAEQETLLAVMGSPSTPPLRGALQFEDVVANIDMRRLNVVLGVKVGWFVARVALLAYVVLTSFSMKPGVFALEMWSVVLLWRFLANDLIDILLLVYWKHATRPPSCLYVFQTSLYTFGLLWFLWGTKLLFLDKPVDKTSAAYFWASIFWWLQSLGFIVPCLIYSLTCLCLPCLVLAVVRLRVPERDQRPTPERIMSLMEVISYGDLVNRLRRIDLESGRGAPLADGGPTASPSPQMTTIVGNLGAAALRLAGNTPTPPQPAVAGDWNKACPICIAEFENSDMVMVMPCDDRHFFHKSCVAHWLNNSQVCPICRANVVELVAPGEGGSGTSGSP